MAYEWFDPDAYLARLDGRAAKVAKPAKVQQAEALRESYSLATLAVLAGRPLLPWRIELDRQLKQALRAGASAERYELFLADVRQLDTAGMLTSALSLGWEAVELFGYPTGVGWRLDGGTVLALSADRMAVRAVAAGRILMIHKL